MRNQRLTGVAAWPALVLGILLALLLLPAPARAQDQPYVDEWAGEANKAPAKKDDAAEADDGDDEAEAAKPAKPAKAKPAKKKADEDEDEDEGEEGEAGEAGEHGSYGSIGTIVLRGLVEGMSSSRTESVGAMGMDTKISASTVTLAPEVGYFFVDQLELGGALPLSFTSRETKIADKSNKTSGSGYGLSLYALYHLPRNEHTEWVVGGDVGYGSQSLTDDSGTSTTTSGWNIGVRGGFEIIFGSGGWGLLDIEAVARYESLSGEMDAKSSGTDLGVRTSLGVAFP